MGKQKNYQRSNWILRAVVFIFLGASIFNSLPLSLRNINSRVLFRKALDDYYLVISIVVLNVFNLVHSLLQYALYFIISFNS